MHEGHSAPKSDQGRAGGMGPYRGLLVMAGLSFISMYVLMYAMVDVFANVLPNLNQFYMAGLMTGPMVLIELLVMAGMYRNTRLNAIIIGVTALASIAFFALIRMQAGISDKQFLKSMIPHHASALLMCEQAPITDPEILALCENIKSGQQAEIDQMRALLSEMNQRPAAE